ncbi:35226_t:CDS:2, partial [Gigaspora margarita]
MEQMLEKCGSCELNSNKGKEVCLSWIWKEDIQGVYPKIQNVANQKVLPVPKEIIAKKKTGNSQVSNKALSLDLLKALEQNPVNRKEVYKFYMDGSLS